MTSIRNVLAGTLLAGGALLTAATSFSIASAADESTPPAATTTPSGPHWHHHGEGPWHLYSKLGLTPEQQTSIKAIMTVAKPQMKSLHQQMQANHLKLMQTKPDDPNYANVVAEVAQSNASLTSQRTSQQSELRAQMYAVLTPAQKTQLATLEAQWAANAAARKSAQ
ncbi:MAG: Spy/CpxP family protein refolding chaperone [Steroidobacteraceae bacterium]